MAIWNHADLHIRVDGRLTVEKGHAIFHHVKARIQQKIPSYIDAMIHIEPVVQMKPFAHATAQ